MQYVLKPAQNDVLHSSKGVKWKNHKYVEIVTTKNGKRRYVYKSDQKNRRDKISAEYKRNTAKTDKRKQQYDNELKLLDANQKLTEMNRPVGAKIQNAFMNLYANAYGLLEKSGLLDKKIEKERLMDEKAKLEARLSADKFVEVQNIRKDWDAKKGADLINYGKEKREREFYKLQEQINKDLEEKKQKREEAAAKAKAKADRATNFRNRISYKGGK